MKKYFSEAIGTMVLVLFGCGSAVIAGEDLGIFGIAMAFGLSVIAMSYAIGKISGCHINPAVSLGVFLCNKMTVKDFVCYVIAQVTGAIAGSAILTALIGMTNLGSVVQTGLGQNGFGNASAVGLSVGGALIVEIILTFVFVLTILGVTDLKRFNNVAGIVIGLTLTFVHIIGIPLTGTSVNPARSLAPALLLGGETLSQVWVFIVAPFMGATLAACVWKMLVQKKAVK